MAKKPEVKKASQPTPVPEKGLKKLAKAMAEKVQIKLDPLEWEGAEKKE